MVSEKTRIVGASAIGQTFFPHQDLLAQLLSTFGVFADRLPDAAAGEPPFGQHRRSLRPARAGVAAAVSLVATTTFRDRTGMPDGQPANASKR